MIAMKIIVSDFLKHKHLHSKNIKRCAFKTWDILQRIIYVNIFNITIKISLENQSNSNNLFIEHLIHDRQWYLPWRHSCEDTDSLLEQSQDGTEQADWSVVQVCMSHNSTRLWPSISMTVAQHKSVRTVMTVAQHKSIRRTAMAVALHRSANLLRTLWPFLWAFLL